MLKIDDHRTHLCLIYIYTLTSLLVIACLFFQQMSRSNPNVTLAATRAPSKSRILPGDVSECASGGGDNPLLLDKGEWSIVVSGDGRSTVAIYSAFYDDRLTLMTGQDESKRQNFVRIHALLGLSKDTAVKLEDLTMYCFFHFKDKTYPAFANKSITTLVGRSEGYDLGNDIYYQYLVSCPLPNSSFVPDSISLAFDRCPRAHLLVKVRVPPKRPDHVVAICVPISFGTIDESLFIEWMEFYRYVGVRSVHVYDAGMTSMSRVFDYYRRQRVLHVHPLRPIQDNSGIGGVKLNSAISLNDCMMRHMYDAEYVLSVDFDEFILLKKHRNFRDLVLHLEAPILKKTSPSNSKILSYNWEQTTFIFRNVLFFLDHPKTKKSAGRLLTATHVFSHKLEDELAGCKSLVNPRVCLSIFNHLCYIFLPPGDLNKANLMPVDVASNNHYRKCTLGPSECARAFKRFEEDQLLRKMERKLSRIVNAVEADIKNGNL